MSETLYKVLSRDGSCYHGGQGKWHLPTKGKPGKWMPKVPGELSPCSNGYHVLKVEMLMDWIAPVAVFAVETRGEVVWADNKGVAREARLLRVFPAWTEQAARLFACDCSENLRDSVPVGEQEEHAKCLLTIRRYAFGMANDAELDGARAWAWAGARARAWAGAWAWAGARARAWAGAWAWASSDKTIRAWETKRLLEYLNGDVDLEAIRRSLAP